MIKLIIVLPTMERCRQIQRELALAPSDVVLVSEGDIKGGRWFEKVAGIHNVPVVGYPIHPVEGYVNPIGYIKVGCWERLWNWITRKFKD